MDNENSKDEISTKKETEDINIENNKEIIKEDSNKNKDVIKNIEIKENNNEEIAKEDNTIVSEDNKFINDTIEPKRIKIPLVGLVLALIIIIIGITVGTIMLLQLN